MVGLPDLIFGKWCMMEGLWSCAVWRSSEYIQHLLSFTRKCTYVSSGTTVGIIVWLNQCVCVLYLSVCPHWLIVRHNKALEIQPPGGLTWMRRPPTFSLKTAMVQLRLRYTTMWQSHTRANICDLDATFKYGPIDGSFALLYFTSLNANWFPAVCNQSEAPAPSAPSLLLRFLKPLLV